MTLQFFQPSKQKRVDNNRYFILQFDSSTYQIVDSVENREVCVCLNYDEREDAKEWAEKIAKLLNENISE